MENTGSATVSKTSRLFDLLGLAGLAFALPTALYICGYKGPATFLEKSLGSFGTPQALLLVFLATTALRMLFGSVKRALPVLGGLAVGVLCLASVFDFPYLAGVRAFAARFPAFGEPGPAFFAGLAALLTGTIAGQFERGPFALRFLAAPGLALAALLILAGLKPFPKTAPDELSMETALRRISETIGYEYRDPTVEKKVKELLADRDKTLAEKEKTIAELAERLAKAEADKAAIAKSGGDAARLGAELEAAKKALAELRDKASDATPLLVGGSYDKAVQPMDALVRDFAVGVAKASPGAFDQPQGSRRPTREGLRQVALVHGAISSSWKYVSDPGVRWSDYVSPAHRTIALGMAGDCDDFAVAVASCVTAIGGRARIMHGYSSKGGHAWAELWLGDSATRDQALAYAAEALGRPASAIAIDKDSSGDRWLIMDWRLGELSINPSRLEVGWTGAR